MRAKISFGISPNSDKKKSVPQNIQNLMASNQITEFTKSKHKKPNMQAKQFMLDSAKKIN